MGGSTCGSSVPLRARLAGKKVPAGFSCGKGFLRPKSGSPGSSACQSSARDDGSSSSSSSSVPFFGGPLPQQQRRENGAADSSSIREPLNNEPSMRIKRGPVIASPTTPRERMARLGQRQNKQVEQLSGEGGHRIVVPLNDLMILNLPSTHTDKQRDDAREAALAGTTWAPCYSARTNEMRRAVVEAADARLARRSALGNGDDDQESLPSSSSDSTLDLPLAYAPAALALLHEAGRGAVAISIGNQVLSGCRGTLSEEVLCDVRVAMALSACECGRTTYQGGATASAAADHLHHALSLLDPVPLAHGEGAAAVAAMAPSANVDIATPVERLVVEIRASLESLSMPCILEHLTPAEEGAVSAPGSPEVGNNQDEAREDANALASLLSANDVGEKSSTRRANAIRALRHVLRNATYESSPKPAYVLSAMERLTSGEICTLARYEDLLIAAVDGAGDEAVALPPWLSDEAVVRRAALAFAARGISTEDPESIATAARIFYLLQRAGDLDTETWSLQQLQLRQQQQNGGNDEEANDLSTVTTILMSYLEDVPSRVDTRLECAMCATLLGQLEDAEQMLREGENGQMEDADAVARRGRASRLRREAWRFVVESSPPEAGEGTTPGLLACTSRWLASACLPFFADTKLLEPNLMNYFESPAVQRYADSLAANQARKSGGHQVEAGVVVRLTETMRAALRSLGDAVASMPSSSSSQQQQFMNEVPASRVSPQLTDTMTNNNAVAFLEPPPGVSSMASSAPAAPSCPRLLDPLTWPRLARQVLFAAAVGAAAALVRPLGGVAMRQWNATTAPSTATATAAMSTSTAKKTTAAMAPDDVVASVRRWNTAKADAMGLSRRVHALDGAATESMRSEWQTRATAAKAAHVYWEFQLKDVKVVSVDRVTMSDPPTCRAKVMVRESAMLRDDRTGQRVPGGTGSYDGAYVVIYEFTKTSSLLPWQSNWKVSKATVSR